ncbi:MAG: VOC family protein [Saprospiraceae bacterium]|nr:VOC family protein [Saprospiraceae bacterium]
MKVSANQQNVTQAVPFFLVTNIKASLKYYVEGLGFQMTNSWIDNGNLRWCWLEIGDAAIMLQEFRADESGVNTEKNLGEGVEIYFICNDALTIYNRVTERGISTSEPFVGNKMWVVGLRDPDGYKITFESPTDIPEETNYIEWIKNKIDNCEQEGNSD